MSGQTSHFARASIFLSIILGAAGATAHSPFDSQIVKSLAGPVEIRPNDILLEDFEGAWPPPGWSRIIGDPLNTWERTGIKSHSGLYSAWMHYGPQGDPLDEWLVTPAMDFSDRSRIYLEFYEDQQYWSGFGSHHYIAVSTTDPLDPSSFTILEDWTPDNHAIPGFGGSPVFVDLSDYVGEAQVYLAFRYTGEWSDTWFIDDVRVYFPDQLDAAALAVIPDQEQFQGGDEIAPKVVATNLGAEAISVELSLDILESGSPVYSESLLANLGPAQIDTLQFPNLVLRDGNYYGFEAETHLDGDEYPPNDLATGFVDTYTEPHIPLGWLHTNAGSGPSLPADILLDDTFDTHPGELSLVRLHTWWPGSDIMYLANPEQSDSLLDEFGIDYVPHFWVDGIRDARFHVDSYDDLFLSSRSIRSPVSLHMVWNGDSQTVIARVREINPLDPAGDYRLRLAVTEDGIEFDGGNGLPVHNQAFRAMVPSVQGLPYTPAIGTTEYEIPCPLDPSWNADQVRLCLFLEDMSNGRVWQSASGRLSDLKAIVFFAPSVSTVGFSGTLSLPIVMYPGVESVKGVEIVVEFDPAVVKLLEILPGPWFTESDYPHYFYDYTPDLPEPNGTLHFAGALLGGESSDAGVVAICRFSGLALGETPLDFMEADLRGPLNQFLDFSTSQADSIIVDDSPTSVGSEAPGPARLLPNYPNPFNPWTRVEVSLDRSERFRLDVFDPAGRLVRTLFDGRLDAGSHDFTWKGLDDHGSALPSGVYLIRLFDGRRTQSVKTVLLR